jgi:hypothetical protein
VPAAGALLTEAFVGGVVVEVAEVLGLGGGGGLGGLGLGVVVVHGGGVVGLMEVVVVRGDVEGAVQRGGLRIVSVHCAGVR